MMADPSQEDVHAYFRPLAFAGWCREFAEQIESGLIEWDASKFLEGAAVEFERLHAATPDIFETSPEQTDK